MHCTVYLWACGRNLNTCRSISYIVPVFVEHRAVVQDYIYIYLGIYLRPSDIGCQYSMSIYTARFIVWQPRRAADTSTSWRQSLFNLLLHREHGTGYADGAETAAIDGLISSWSENIFVSFHRAPRYGLTLWCALGLLVGGAIQVPQLQFTVYS